MKAKRVVSVLLLGFVVASVACLAVKEWNARRGGDETPAVSGADTAVADGVTVYYFFGNVRCTTCRKIEAYTSEAVSAGFTEELADGRLEWRTLNMDEPQHKHFVQDYGLTTRSVVLVEHKNGQQARWKNLDRVWDLVGDKTEFQAYISAETRAYLGDG